MKLRLELDVLWIQVKASITTWFIEAEHCPITEDKFIASLIQVISLNEFDMFKNSFQFVPDLLLLLNVNDYNSVRQKLLNKML